MAMRRLPSHGLRFGLPPKLHGHEIVQLQLSATVAVTCQFGAAARGGAVMAVENNTAKTISVRMAQGSIFRARKTKDSATRGAVWLEVLPDLLDHTRVDDAGVAFLRLFLRIQRELDRPALRPERGGIEDVETFVDRRVSDTLFELERMDWRDFGVAAEGAH